MTVIYNFDPFYDRSIKEKNIDALKSNPAFRIIEGDFRSLPSFENQLEENYDAIIHVGAKAGVFRTLVMVLALPSTVRLI